MKNIISTVIALLLCINVFSQNTPINDQNNLQSAGEIFYNTIPKLSTLFNSITRIYGSGKYGDGSGVVSNVEKYGNKISLCNINGNAGASTFININCLDLVHFEELEDRYNLTFEGPISKMKDTYSIDRSISNGKIVSTINRSGKSSQSGTISFVIMISKKTSNFYYKFCLLDSNGNPDCGMGTYQGELNYNQRQEIHPTPPKQTKKKHQ